MAFHCRDAADPELSGRYDLVTIFEALHDMSYPVDVLRAARALLSDGGRVLVADERTAERFALDAGDVERLYYGFSVLHCLPVGMVGENAAGTGTVMREDTVQVLDPQGPLEEFVSAFADLARRYNGADDGTARFASEYFLITAAR